MAYVPRKLTLEAEIDRITLVGSMFHLCSWNFGQHFSSENEREIRQAPCKPNRLKISLVAPPFQIYSCQIGSLHFSMSEKNICKIII